MDKPCVQPSLIFVACYLQYIASQRKQKQSFLKASQVDIKGAQKKVITKFETRRERVVTKFEKRQEQSLGVHGCMGGHTQDWAWE